VQPERKSKRQAVWKGEGGGVCVVILNLNLLTCIFVQKRKVYSDEEYEVYYLSEILSKNLSEKLSEYFV
jgi:hypothetical protein